MTKIIINGFERFNPRKDRAKHSWFRTDNTIMFSEALDGLAADQKWFWICLLSVASRKHSDEVAIDLPYLEKHSGVSRKKITAALRHLESRNAISILSGSASLVTDGSQSATNGTTTYERTNVRTNKQSDFDFESVRNLYPKPKGADAEDRFRDQVQTPTDYADLIAAIEHYKIMLSLPENSWRRPKQTFATFLGTKTSGFFWRDFIDPKSAQPTNQKPDFTVQE